MKKLSLSDAQGVDFKRILLQQDSGRSPTREPGTVAFAISSTTRGRTPAARNSEREALNSARAPAQGDARCPYEFGRYQRERLRLRNSEQREPEDESQWNKALKETPPGQQQKLHVVELISSKRCSDAPAWKMKNVTALAVDFHLKGLSPSFNGLAPDI
jgi:hypothetical protein